MNGYGPPVCVVPLTGPDEFMRLPLKPGWTLDRDKARMVPGNNHGAASITVDGRSFRKSGKRTTGGWLIYTEIRP